MLTPTALRTRWALRDLVRSGVAMSAPRHGVHAMGLCFPGALGIAAGFDSHGALVGRAERLGLGSVEIGSLCAGSRDLARAIRALRRTRGRCRREARAVHGVSLIKRAATPWPDAHAELAGALHALRGSADYVTLNPGRDRPAPALFAELVAAIARGPDRPAGVPLVVKLPAGWLRGDQAPALAAGFAAAGADGLLLSAEGMDEAEHLAALRRLRAALGPVFCLISVGGIAGAGAAVRRLRAGATLVQAHGALRRSQRREFLRHAVAALARVGYPSSGLTDRRRFRTIARHRLYTRKDSDGDIRAHAGARRRRLSGRSG